MKRIVLIIFTLLFVFLTDSFHTKEDPAADLLQPEMTAAAPVMPEEHQKQLIMDNYELWAYTEPWDSPWFYTFTDLDHNGRLEVIAAVTQGTGIFTYVNYYEVSADGTAIENCYHKDIEIEGPDDWPEIILDSLTCYYDTASDRYYYPCEGVTRSGFAYQYYMWEALCLKNGAAEWEFLASKEVNWDEQSNPHTSCLNAAGNTITEQDYNSAVELRFAGMECSEMKLDWTKVEVPWPEEEKTFSEGTTAEPTFYEENYLASYSSVLDAYREAYARGEGKFEYAMQHDLSEVVRYSDGVGYTLTDVDGNGIPELILEGIGTDEFSEGIAFGIYTLVNNQPVNLATSWVRDRYYVCTDNTILNEGSGGAGHSVAWIFRVSGQTLEPVEGVKTSFDGTDSDGYYRQTDNLTWDLQPEDQKIDEDAFRNAVDEYESKICTLTLTRIV